MVPLGPFEPAPTVAVAASGGADSMALALLAAQWAAAQGGKAIALTIDHRLRPESTAEAEQVGRWLVARNIEHRVLAWGDEKPAAGVQAAARDARYRLLEGHCRERGILHLLTAHHRDDQAETVLLRLAKGSGVDGLSGIPPRQPLGAVRLLRPLLQVDPARLRATCVAAGQGWAEDPSNQQARFARPRLRAVMGALAREGLTSESLNSVADRSRRARQALEHAAAAVLATACAVFPEGYALLNVEPIVDCPSEIGLRALGQCIAVIGGNRYGARMAALERVSQEILVDGPARPRTLGGCVLSQKRGRILIRREQRAVAAPERLTPGVSIRWDGRFLALASATSRGFSIGALGAAGWAELAQKAPHLRQTVVPAPVRPTLPAIYDSHGLAAVPHLGYARLAAQPCSVRLHFAPAHSLTGFG